MCVLIKFPQMQELMQALLRISSRRNWWSKINAACWRIEANSLVKFSSDANSSWCSWESSCWEKMPKSKERKEMSKQTRRNTHAHRGVAMLVQNGISDFRWWKIRQMMVEWRSDEGIRNETIVAWSLRCLLVQGLHFPSFSERCLRGVSSWFEVSSGLKVGECVAWTLSWTIAFFT